MNQTPIPPMNPPQPKPLGGQSSGPFFTQNPIFNGVTPMAKPSQKPIDINPANKGKLTAKVGKAGLKTGALTKTIAKAKSSGNTKLEKEAVFAKNAKKWHHGDGSAAEAGSAKGKLAKPKITHLASPIGGY